MGFSYNVNVLNQKGSPALYTDTFANRPNFGYAGRLFIANDTSAIYEDTGTAWVLIANVSSGAGTLQQVTTNGNTSNVGISVTAGGISTNSLTDTALTLGSVLFSGAAGLVSQDNAAFFWDDTNNRLGINTTTPTNTLDLHFAGTNAMLGLNNTAGNQSSIVFANTGTNKWRMGNTATNTFDLVNVGLGTNAISVNSTNNTIGLTGNLNGTTANLGNTNGTVGVLNVSGRIALTTSIFFSSNLTAEDRWEINGTNSTYISFTKSPVSEFMRLTNSGNFLINSTTDDTVSKLQVTGASKFNGTVGIGTSSGSVKLYTKSDTATSSTYALGCENGSVNIFLVRGDGVITISNLSGTGSRAVLADASGNLSAPVSDQSVKQNIEPLKYGLETILQLNAVQFEFIESYKNYGEGLQIGAIAQEIEQIIPEAVFTTPSTGLKGIDYNQLNGIYIKAIQDQQKIIESLIKRIELLENKLL